MTPEEIAAKEAADKAAADKKAADDAAAAQKTADDAKKLADEEAAKGQNNAENAARRKLEKAEKERDEALAKLKTREDADLTETERLKKDLADAKKVADEAKREALLARVGKDLPDEALEFLTGADEDALTAQAEKLKTMFGTKAEPKAPVRAGTKTAPGGAAQPTVHEKIAAATKSGNITGAIRLMRAEQFGDKE